MKKRIKIQSLFIIFHIIRWPPPQRQVEIATAVEEVSSLPGVIGFIDGSHIRLSAALGGEQDYYNRKGYPSMQLQVYLLIHDK